tara:strand:+ start:253 stop:1149 length:897 start_codon:yes stop_codon:yes gene_type:complete
MATASPMRAAAWMMGALISFSTMAVATREISAELDTVQLMFYRSLAALAIISTIVLALPGRRERLRTRRLPMHAMRNLVHFVGQFGWFHAIALIPLVQVIALEFTTPLWVALLAPLFLRERLTWNRLAAAVVGFAGVMLVLRPGITTVNEGTIAVLIAAMGFAGSILFTKKLSATEAPLTILFYMGAVQMPVSFLAALIGDVLTPPTSMGWILVVIVAICGLGAHFSIARALAHADVVVVAPLDFLRLPIMAVVGFLLYAEGLELWVLAGGALIVLANYGNVVLESRAVSPRVVPSSE